MISFVVPTLNEQGTIANTLECLAAYGGEHEIVVSDGRSTDGTVEICRKYTDKIVVHDHSYRQTIADARNAGAAIARGKYLVFVDADVTVPDVDAFFHRAHDAFRSIDRLVALTCKYRVLPAVSTAADRYVFTTLGWQFLLQNNVFRVGAAGGEFQMITADAFRSVGGFDPTLVAAEDMDLFRRLSRIGRTHFARDLTIYHSGRRAHSIGWPRLLWQWFSNSVSVFLFKRSVSSEWEAVR